MSLIKILNIAFTCVVLFTDFSLALGEEELRPWLRTDGGITFMRRNRDMSMIAFIPDDNTGLRIVDTKNGNVYAATDQYTGGSFFWSPDNARVFFRELLKTGKKVTSEVKAWDAVLKKTVKVDSVNGSSGMLTFDPRDQRLMLMHEKGIMSKRLVFPDERLAYWQSAHRTDKGKFVASAGGMTYVTQQGFAMSKMTDDGTGIESFDLSPNGDSVVWATNGGKIYVSLQGEPAKFLDYGRDPQWHPKRDLIAYAGAKMVGNKAAQYDLKISTASGSGSFLTSTQARSERWPMWSPDGHSLVYTISGTTDIFTLSTTPKTNVTEPK